jgi:superfamily II DNA or RNA helicase
MEMLNNKYTINIYERYVDLKKSNKPELDNNDLWKIFEYYSCLKLSEEFKKPFYEYDDIEPTFKELNKMSRNDTGIDLSDLDKTIVQCKLRKNTLTWKECSTFFGSIVIFNKELNEPIVRWKHLIITRNNDCILSENLLERKELFIDRPYIKQELIKFCESLIVNPPKYPVINNNYVLRDYQIESINIITQNKKNVIINLPTGTGKNSVIIYSFQDNKKYLILVPRIILMDQLKEEIIKHKPTLKNKIQLIGDTNIEFKDNKLITICVFNSVSIVENYANTFEKIYIDEAHHINKPEIYCYEDDNIVNDDEVIIEQLKDDDDERNTEEQTDDEYIEEQTDDELIEELTDDTEDELKNVKSYTQIIKSLVKHNNNVYLSATIDKTDEFEYYSKDIRDMINLGYLCDYTIHIPIFSEDPNNIKICEHLLKNYRNIIIYCNSQKEGKEINKLMNTIQNNSSEYIDCNTPKKKRNDIINKYKDGKIPFLVNVRILVEGFDAPITKGVCFLHMPNNKTTLIQIIGRCLRLHPTKTIANIILPFSSKEDEKNICNFLKVMAKNDSRIKKSFENKQLGGYISINITEETEDEDINDNIEFKYNMVYDSMGVLNNGKEIWITRLEEVKKYIDEHNKRPSSTSKNNQIGKMGRWLLNQKRYYKQKKYAFKNENICNIYYGFINDPKYQILFLSQTDAWYNKFEDFKNYLNRTNKRPSSTSKDIEEKKYGIWFINQDSNFRYKNDSMKINNIYDTWSVFRNDNKFLFVKDEDKWIKNYNELLKYFDENNNVPSYKNNKILYKWLSHQKDNYKNETDIMKHEHIYKLWTDIRNNEKYAIFLMSYEEKWFIKFEELNLYYKINKHLPNRNTHLSLSQWISSQNSNYREKADLVYNNINIKDAWEKFNALIGCDINEKQNINEKKWIYKLETLKKYIILNNKLPTITNKNNEISQLGSWLARQKQNYKNKEHTMKYENINKQWKEFINNNIYIQYFKN